jgi:hypothetical protein
VCVTESSTELSDYQFRTLLSQIELVVSDVVLSDCKVSDDFMIN